jgi:anaerobic ribonucleoside-triphosphate reductase activating protein
MRISINKAHFPITVLGPGRRIGIWLQGCSIRCPGCISQDTWESDRSYECKTETIVRWCREVTANKLDGVTITGGEPFEQPDALHQLVDELDGWRKLNHLEFDVLVYSGFRFKYLIENHRNILERLDAIIPEPFVHGQQENLLWRGSRNQPIVPLSKKGHQLYGQGVLINIHRERRLQMIADAENIWFAGIPKPGDMDRLSYECEKKGLKLNNCSWRP